MIDAPAELASRPQWVAWRLVQREGEPKPTKVPIDARTGRAASTTDPSTWASFLEANAYADAHAHGIGYVLSADDPYVGLDLDQCRNVDTGAVEGWAKAIIRRMSSYTEISPSGSGLRIFVRGELPPHGRRKGHIEVYQHARFLTVTGMRYLAAPGSIEERSKELLEWHHDVFGEPAPTPATERRVAMPPPDIDILLVAQRANNGGKFMALWNGDYSSYDSQSEADLALVNLLAFYCGPDPARIDVLFRLSGLWRDKWEREDYRAWTIGKALEGRTDFYDPNYRSNGASPQLTIPPTAPAKGELWLPPHGLINLGADHTRQLVEHLIWEGRTHWVYSGPGAGKTLFELALLLHMAAGKPFHGLEVVQGASVIFEEDSPHAVLGDYMQLLADIYELDLESLPVLTAKPRGLHITDKASADYIRWMISEAPEKPLVCLIDACERVVPSEAFNSKELEPLANLFTQNLADGITNIMIDHTRKAQPTGGEKVDPIELLYGGRTKSAISDVMLYMSGRIRDRALLTFPKFRGEAPTPISIKFDGHAGFTLGMAKVQLTESQQDVMRIVNNLFGKDISADEIAEVANLHRRATQRALKSLVDLGWLERSGATNTIRYRATGVSGGIFS